MDDNNALSARLELHVPPAGSFAMTCSGCQ